MGLKVFNLFHKNLLISVTGLFCLGCTTTLKVEQGRHFDLWPNTCKKITQPIKTTSKWAPAALDVAEKVENVHPTQQWYSDLLQTTLGKGARRLYLHAGGT